MDIMARQFNIGSSNWANRSDTNGGGYDLDNYTGTFAQSRTATGGPVATATTAVVTDGGGGTLQITKTGAFTNAIVGLYAYVNFAATYTDGWYEVVQVVSNDAIRISTFTYSSDTTCDINVGGFLSTAAFPDGNGLVGAGDIIAMVDSTSSHTLSNNWLMTSGSAGSPVTYKLVDSDGNDIIPQRALQNGRRTGLLSSGSMATIECGTYQVVKGNYNVLQGLHVRGETGDYVLEQGTNALIHACCLENYKVSNNWGGCLQTGNYSKVVDVDLVSASTTLSSAYSTEVLDVGTGSTVTGCTIKSASSSATLVDSSLGCSIINNIFIGASSANGLAVNLSVSYQALIANNTFYNCVIAVDFDSGTPGSVTAANNLAVDCTTFFYNDRTTDIELISVDNCLEVTNDYTGNTKGFVGLVGISDTSSSQTADQMFITPGTDFSLEDDGDARGVGILARDCGAVDFLPDYPSVGNVRNTDTTDGSSGTYAPVAESNVKNGVQYGAGGTEFTGTYTAGGGGDESRLFGKGIFD